MPLLINRNPSYRKHRASRQAIVTIDGYDLYLGPHGTKASKAEYDRHIGEWLANGRRMPGNGLSDISISEVVDRFFEHAKTYYRLPDGSASTEIQTIKQALAVVNHLYGATPAASFGPLALDACRLAMVQKQWCRKYINAQIARLKMVFKWAVSKELIPPSVHHALVTVAGLRRGKSDARESLPVRPVDDATVDATLPHCSTIIKAMIQLQRLTGARPGEICSMRIGDIDRAGEVWTHKPAEHKTAHHGHDRVIQIGPKAQAVMQPFLMTLDPAAFVFSPVVAVAEMRQERAESRQTPMTCGNVPGSNLTRKPKRRPGARYSVAAYRRAIARACDAADTWEKAGRIVGNVERLIPRWHPHQLRHSAATAIRKRFGLEAAQHVLGHATLSMTEIYAEKNADIARAVAAAVG